MSETRSKGRGYTPRNSISEEKTAACVTKASSEQTVMLPSGENVPIMIGVGSIGEGLELTEGFIGKQKVTVLRDTGCTGVVTKKQFVRPEEMTGRKKRCVLIDKTALLCPVANIYTFIFLILLAW